MAHFDSQSISRLEAIAKQLRVDSLKATTAAGSGHPTTCLSAADLVAGIFFHAMRFDPKNPKDPNAGRRFLEISAAYDVLSDPSLRRAYDLARAGEEVVLASREVTVSRFEVLDVRRTAGAATVDVDVVVEVLVVVVLVVVVLVVVVVELVVVLLVVVVGSVVVVLVVEVMVDVVLVVVLLVVVVVEVIGVGVSVGNTS